MALLAINTCLAACDLAIIEQGEVIVEQAETMVRGQDERLPDLTGGILARAGVSLSSLDRIVVVTGPGSFTGIRIGVAFARALALGLGIPAVGLTALEAGIAPGQTGRLSAAMPAQTRPPDRTFWVQDLKGGLALGPVLELAEGTLGVRPPVLATPRAAWAGLKGEAIDPQGHLPAPVYARLPDAAPMAGLPGP